MNSLHVEVVSRGENIYRGDAYYVSAPASSGYVGILPGRQPLLAVMISGTVKIKKTADGEEKNFEVGPGFISVDQDIVKIVIDQF